MPANKVRKQYFAQVGAESIEIDADTIGDTLATSAPVHFYRVRATVGDATFEGVGDSWKAAEAEVDKQTGKVKP